MSHGPSKKQKAVVEGAKHALGVGIGYGLWAVIIGLGLAVVYDQRASLWAALKDKAATTMNVWNGQNVIAMSNANTAAAWHAHESMYVLLLFALVVIVTYAGLPMPGILAVSGIIAAWFLWNAAPIAIPVVVVVFVAWLVVYKWFWQRVLADPHKPGAKHP